MSSSRNRCDDDWSSYRTLIRHWIQNEGKTQTQVRESLKEKGFQVTTDQLRYKLKQWGIRRKVRRDRGQTTWEYIGWNLAARKSNGKTSNTVLIDGRVVGETEIERETRRNLRMIPLYGRPRTPEGVMVSITTPPPMKLNFQEPSELPWLQFSAKVPRIVSTRGEGGPGPTFDLSRLKKWMFPRGPSRSTQSNMTVSSLVYRIAPIMPGGDENENIRRAQIIVAGPPREAVEEMIKVLLFQISNDLFRFGDDEDQWEEILSILHDSGITKVPMELSSTEDSTMFAVAETLFRNIFESAFGWFRAHGRLISLYTTFAKWLLSSGVAADTRIRDNVRPLMECITLMNRIRDENVKDGIFDIIQALLRADARPNKVGDAAEEVPPLTATAKWAAGSRKLKIMRTLIHKGANVNPIEEDLDKSPLMVAIACGDWGAANLLLEHGADVSFVYNEPDKLPFSLNAYHCFNYLDVLTCAAGVKPESVALSLVHLLFEKGCAMSENSLICASLFGNGAVLELLYNRGGNINSIDERGLSPLGVAACHGHVNICELLIRLGVAKNGYHVSPFYWSLLGGQLNMARYLYEKGFYEPNDMNTPVSHQLFSPEYDVSGQKRAFGFADEDIDNDSYEMATRWCATPIGIAIMQSKSSESYSLYKWLVQELGCQLPPWALYFGALTKNIDLVSFAMEAGLDPNFQETTGETVLQAAFASTEGRYIRLSSNLGSRSLTPGCIELELEDSPPEDQDDLPGNKDLVTRIAITLLEAGAIPTGSEICHAINSNQRTLLASILQRSRNSLTTHEVETAIMSTENWALNAIWDIIPGFYSAGALCAATLRASSGGSPDLVSILLKNRAACANDDRNSLETVAVCIASFFRNIKVLELLLRHLPNLQVALHYDEMLGRAFSVPPVFNVPLDHRGQVVRFWEDHPRVIASPLVYAIHSHPVLAMLLDAGYRPDWYTISVTILLGLNEKMEKLLRYRKLPDDMVLLSPGISYLREPHAGNRYTPLRKPLATAVECEDMDTLRLLLEKGESVDETSVVFDYSRNALQLAVEKGNIAMVNILIENGACLSKPAGGIRGATALQIAAKCGHLGIAKNLINSGVDVNEPRSPILGYTALEGAAHEGRIDMVKFLLLSGALTRGPGCRQYFMAVYYARKKYQAVTTLLVEWGSWDGELDKLLSRLETLQRAKNIRVSDKHNPNRLIDQYRLFEEDEDLPGTLKARIIPNDNVSEQQFQDHMLKASDINFRGEEDEEVQVDIAEVNLTPGERIQVGTSEMHRTLGGDDAQAGEIGIDWTLGVEGLGHDSFWHRMNDLDS